MQWRGARLGAPMGDGMAAVISGVGMGERIVTAGVHSLADGQKVRVEGETL